MGLEDLTNQKFNKLTVLEYAYSKNRKRYWKCECECGNITYVTTNNLKSGHVKTCGCSRQEIKNNIDITNQKFNRLTAIKIKGRNKHSNIIWECLCDCGNKTEATATDLIQGRKKSCGCLNKEKIIERNIANREVQIGKLYGYLLITGDAGYELNSSGKRRHYSYCTCLNCGKTEVRKKDNDLANGQVISCGCIGSFGEKKIENILKQNNIHYEREKAFPGCYITNQSSPVRYDFYVNNEYIIEYDGIQHFKITGGWSTEEKFRETQEHDKFKNNWCKENNIPIIRIPYTYLNNLCLEDLIPETSKFLLE